MTQRKPLPGTGAGTRPGGRTIDTRQQSDDQILEAAFDVGRRYAEAVATQNARDDYWRGYTDALRDLRGADDPRTVEALRAAAAGTGDGTGVATCDPASDNVTDIAAYRCAQRPTRPRGTGGGAQRRTPRAGEAS